MRTAKLNMRPQRGGCIQSGRDGTPDGNKNWHGRRPTNLGTSNGDGSNLREGCDYTSAFHRTESAPLKPCAGETTGPDALGRNPPEIRCFPVPGGDSMGDRTAADGEKASCPERWAIGPEGEHAEMQGGQAPLKGRPRMDVDGTVLSGQSTAPTERGLGRGFRCRHFLYRMFHGKTSSGLV